MPRPRHQHRPAARLGWLALAICAAVFPSASRPVLLADVDSLHIPHNLRSPSPDESRPGSSSWIGLDDTGPVDLALKQDERPSRGLASRPLDGPALPGHLAPLPRRHLGRPARCGPSGELPLPSRPPLHLLFCVLLN